MRDPIPSTRLDDIPGKLPNCSVPETVDLQEVEQLTLTKLNNLKRADLADETTWRDIVALTGTYRTLYSGDKVYSTIQALLRDSNCSDFKLVKNSTRVVSFGWIDVSVIFETRRNGIVGKCAGGASIGLFPDGQWRIWLIRTWLENFQGHNHPDILQPGQQRQTINDTETYDAVIVGAGQGGLSNAGRLQALGLKYVLLEKYDRIGDIWRKRYASLHWHTPKEYGNLPFGRTYLPDDDDLLPAARIADSHQAWAEQYGINVRTGTTVDSARYDAATRLWTIKTSSKGGSTTIRAKNLILSIGPGVVHPVSPAWASTEKIAASGYKGVVMHSASYVSCDAWKGPDKKGVVIGTANTGFDVAEDMANAGLNTTMVQRGKTFIMPAELLHASMQKDYNENKPTEQGDRDAYTYPVKVGREMTNMMIHSIIRAGPDKFDELEATGFQLDRFGDIFNNLCIRMGGHYIDTGGCQRLIDGDFKVVAKSIQGLCAEGLLFEDGSTLPADVIVLATGFDHDFARHAATIIGEEAAGQMEDYWGLDAEGELRGQGKIAGFPNLYYQGGDIRHCRWISRFIALQIQAELLGQRLALSKI